MPGITTATRMGAQIATMTPPRLHINLTSHFNERAAFISILEENRFLKAGDMFLFDRGYFSTQMVTLLQQHNMNFIFRLKRDAFKGAKQFFNSSRNSCKVLIGNQSVVLTKYFIDGKKYMCLTSKDVEMYKVKDLYKERWRVEEHFKRLKSYLGIEHISATSLHSFLQDVEIRVFLDWLALSCNKKSGKPQPQVIVLDTLPVRLDWKLGRKSKCKCQFRQNLCILIILQVTKHEAEAFYAVQ
jgi:hypothetical protein